MRRIVFASFFCLVLISRIFSQNDGPVSLDDGLRIFALSYPEIDFTAEYDRFRNDFRISVDMHDGSKRIFYWAGGSMLPVGELADKDKYGPLIYEYSDMKDPATMTESERKTLREFASRSNRRNGKGTPMFFFDALYSSFSRSEVERHIVQTEFLGKNSRVHERILPKLKNVNDKIMKAAASDTEIKKFVDGIKSADGYNWRIIDGTNRKSFHSLGIAIDILPKKIRGEIFWSWARDKNPDGWMLTPISRRWIPPRRVIDIFEEEGFIWGGNWGIWDNMHFEYHPELVANKK